MSRRFRGSARRCRGRPRRVVPRRAPAGVEAPAELGQWGEQRQSADDDVERLRARHERANVRRVERSVTSRASSRSDASAASACPPILAPDEREMTATRACSGDRALERPVPGVVAERRDERDRGPRSRACITAARRSSSPSSECRSVGSIVAARIASAASAALRDASGNGCPNRIVASAPNGTCSSSSSKPCRRAAALMPRLAWAITSGPIPSPARQAIE